MYFYRVHNYFLNLWQDLDLPQYEECDEMSLWHVLSTVSDFRYVSENNMVDCQLTIQQESGPKCTCRIFVDACQVRICVHMYGRIDYIRMGE